MSLRKYLLTEALTRILLTEGAENIIVSKMGLGEEYYKWLRKNVNKKLHIWHANVINSYLDYLRDTVGANGDNETLIKRMLSKLESGNETPAIFSEVDEFINIISQDNKPQMNLKEYRDFENVREFIHNWATIRDYRDASTPPPNLKTMSVQQAFEESREWHAKLKDSGLSAQIKDVAPDAEIIHTFENGWKWVDMKTSKCGELGDLMGHCANTEADTMLQLISDDGKFHVTVAFNYDGEYLQAKGRRNKKPNSDVDEYMEWLFTNNGRYQLKGYKPEYQDENDYKVEDLPSEELIDDLKEKYPDLIKINPIEEAEELYVGGDIEGALDIINDNGGYDSIEVIGFDGQFENFILDFSVDEVFDRIATEILSFGLLTVDRDTPRIIVEHILKEKVDVDLFIEEILDIVQTKEVYSGEVDKKINQLLIEMSQNNKDAVNNIISNIVRDDPKRYIKFKNINRLQLIESVIKEKVSSDSGFRTRYDKLFRSFDSKSKIKRSLGKDVEKKLYQFLQNFEAILNRIGFIDFTSEGGFRDFYYILYANMDWLYNEEGDILSYILNYDSVINEINDNIDDELLYKNESQSITELLSMAEKLRKMEDDEKIDDASTELLLLQWLTGVESPISMNGEMTYFMDQMVKDGYLDSSLISARSDKDQLPLFF